MKLIIIFLLLIPFFNTPYAQSKFEETLDFAFKNAKKGVYWAYSNIPVKKAKLENDLIASDKLVAAVKIWKEVNGIKVESTGYHSSVEIKIVVYRSYESLLNDGIIKDKSKYELIDIEN